MPEDRNHHPEGHHGHQDGHRHFDPQFFLSMEERRRAMMAPEAVLGDFLQGDDAVLADIGAGAGFFALPAARRLQRGKVFAIDRQEDMLQVVRQRVAAEGLGNVVPIHAPAHAIPLEAASVDAVLMSNVFHDIEEQDAALREVSRILRPGGAFYLVEWDKVDTGMGPALDISIAPQELEGALARAGYRIEQRFDGPAPFYRVLARKA